MQKEELDTHLLWSGSLREVKAIAIKPPVQRELAHQQNLQAQVGSVPGESDVPSTQIAMHTQMLESML